MQLFVQVERSSRKYEIKQNTLKLAQKYNTIQELCLLSVQQNCI